MNLKNTPLYAESWNVAFRIYNSGSILENKSKEFVVIPNSINYWAADPMVIEYKGAVYIFAELYDFKLCRGTIGYTKYDGKNFGQWKQIIVEDFHMSYPNVFIWNNEVYMIPETSEANELIMYKATIFPDKWEKYRTLKSDVKWVDTTFVKRETGYIAYTETQEPPTDDIILQFDDEFNIVDEKVVAHNANTLRCGGRIFNYENKIIRVCQDCSEKYGGALIFRVCDEKSLEESECIRITAEDLMFDKNILLDGMHTYTCLDNMEVIDIKTRRFNLINFTNRIKNKIIAK